MKLIMMKLNKLRQRRNLIFASILSNLEHKLLGPIRVATLFVWIFLRKLEIKSLNPVII